MMVVDFSLLANRFSFFVFRFSLFTLLLFLFSCKASRKVIESPNATVKLKGAEVIQVFDSMLSKQFQFRYLTTKADVVYTDKSGESTSFDINVRMKRDSAIWISITPLLGIEASRLLITPDSVTVLDRVHKTYLKKDYRYFEEMLKTNVNFEMIQAVIVGNYFQYEKKEKLKSLYEEEPFVILSSMNKRQVRRAAEEKDPSKPVTQDFWIDGNYRIAKSRITDDRLNRFVEATYKDFIDVNGFLFPSSLVVTIASVSPSIIKIKYTKAEPADTLQMPFTIPEKYEAK
jgi:hypothetical protein